MSSFVLPTRHSNHQQGTKDVIAGFKVVIIIKKKKPTSSAASLGMNVYSQKAAGSSLHPALLLFAFVNAFGLISGPAACEPTSVTSLCYSGHLALYLVPALATAEPFTPLHLLESVPAAISVTLPGVAHCASTRLSQSAQSCTVTAPGRPADQPAVSGSPLPPFIRFDPSDCGTQPRFSGKRFPLTPASFRMCVKVQGHTACV